MVITIVKPLKGYSNNTKCHTAFFSFWNAVYTAFDCETFCHSVKMSHCVCVCGGGKIVSRIIWMAPYLVYNCFTTAKLLSDNPTIDFSMQN